MADLLIVTASIGSDRGLFVVPADAPSLVRTALPTLDPTRRLASLTLADTPATPVAIGGDAVQQALDLAAVLLAAEQVGGAEHCLQNATDYAKIRVQFDSPIGSFQAIKHLLADLLFEVESARAAADYAAWAAACAPAELVQGGPADQGRLLGHLRPRREGELSGSRRHRVHVETRRTPAPQAGYGR